MNEAASELPSVYVDTAAAAIGDMEVDRAAAPSTSAARGGDMEVDRTAPPSTSAASDGIESIRIISVVSLSQQ